MRKNVKEYRKFEKEPFEFEKHSFIIYGVSNTPKTSIINKFVLTIKTIYCSCEDDDEWYGYNTYSTKKLYLLDVMKKFANSLLIFDGIGEES